MNKVFVYKFQIKGVNVLALEKNIGKNIRRNKCVSYPKYFLVPVHEGFE